MSEFTAGKWIKHGDFIIGNTVCLAQVLSVHEHEDDAERNRIEKSANARLIASAPEMYELLKVWTEIQAQPTLMEAQETARELLARIDGEEEKV